MNQECSDLSYLTQNSIDALTCQAISDEEWILIFARMYLSAYDLLSLEADAFDLWMTDVTD